MAGMMLVTPDFVMFDPDECSQSNTVSLHSMSSPMSAVMSVSVYHDDSLSRCHPPLLISQAAGATLCY